MPLPAGLLEELKGEAHHVFVETGMHRGDGIARAVKAGFDAVYSCDISEFSFGWCCHRFRNMRDRVHLHCANSRDFLEEILLHCISGPSFFWLDAHWCGGDGELAGKDERYRPVGNALTGELAVIRRFGRQDHTLLIDDVRMFGQDEYFPDLDQVLAELRLINPDYRLEYRDSPTAAGDILVARP